MPRRKKPPASYHHGDLRAALLETAVAIIEQDGLHHLSLRECARRAGVSHAAPYRHFADKHALLMAIAIQGLTWLREAGEAAMAGVTDPRERLDAYGTAYVRFAIEHEAHYRVMFAAELEGERKQEDPGGAFGLLVETVTPLVKDASLVFDAALAAWSLPHGLAMLILDGRIPTDQLDSPEAIERLTRSVLALWHGPLSGPT